MLSTAFVTPSLIGWYCLGNAILLAYMCFFPTDSHTDFSRQAISQSVVVLEALISLPWYLLYLYRVLEFNRCKPPSDVQRHLYNDGNSSIHSAVLDNDASHNMFEDQSDLLKYLTQHSANLQGQIKVLQKRLEESFAQTAQRVSVQ
eukprot:m.22929 g.22929  ORF g.22929 m.22929 type:complete len:146 (-) comp11305_c0_seq3:101-538(-)